MAPTTDTDSTLYPKITNHIAEVVKTLRHLNRDLVNPQKDSRNVTNLSTTKDNQGFATTMSKKTKILLRLRDLYLARWKQLNPNSTLDPSHPVLIAGEWIGSTIQKDIALTQLTKLFVIISLNINNIWQNDASFSGISLPHHDIYNVSRAGVFTATLYPNDIQRTISALNPLAEQIARKCPFAATFGVHGGGEGLVWKLALPQYNSNPTLWFKIKGGKFKPTFARAPKRTQSFDTVKEKRQQAAQVAQVWCSQQRLEQGWDVLGEKGVEKDIRALSEYLKWVQGGVLGEERGDIMRFGVDVGELKIEVARVAKGWFVGRLSRGSC